jgi:hypothetical protein
MNIISLVIKKVLTEQLNKSQSRIIDKYLTKLIGKYGFQMDSLMGVNEYAKRKFKKRIYDDINKGSLGHNLQEISNNLKYLKKMGLVLGVINKMKINDSDKDDLKEMFLYDNFCVKCSNKNEVELSVHRFLNVNSTPDGGEKNYTKDDIEGMYKSRKSSSKIDDIWRKYGIGGSGSLKMGDFTVKVRFNNTFDINSVKFDSSKTYDTTWDSTDKKLIHRVKNLDIHFILNINNDPKKGKTYEVDKSYVIDRSGTTLKSSPSIPLHLNLVVDDIIKKRI